MPSLGDWGWFASYEDRASRQRPGVGQGKGRGFTKPKIKSRRKKR